MASYFVLKGDYGGWDVLGRLNPFDGHKYRDPQPIFHTATLEEAEKKLEETRAKYKAGREKAREIERKFLESRTPEQLAEMGLKPKKEPKPKAPAKPRKKKGEAMAEPVAEA